MLYNRYLLIPIFSGGDNFRNSRKRGMRKKAKKGKGDWEVTS